MQKMKIDNGKVTLTPDNRKAADGIRVIRVADLQVFLPPGELELNDTVYPVASMEDFEGMAIFVFDSDCLTDSVTLTVNGIGEYYIGRDTWEQSVLYINDKGVRTRQTIRSDGDPMSGATPNTYADFIEVGVMSTVDFFEVEESSLMVAADKDMSGELRILRFPRGQWNYNYSEWYNWHYNAKTDITTVTEDGGDTEIVFNGKPIFRAARQSWGQETFILSTDNIFGAKRQERLSINVDEAYDMTVYINMHTPALSVGISPVDEFGLQSANLSTLSSLAPMIGSLYNPRSGIKSTIVTIDNFGGQDSEEAFMGIVKRDGKVYLALNKVLGDHPAELYELGDIPLP